METTAKKTNRNTNKAKVNAKANASSTGKKQNIALDAMEKVVAKAARLAKIEQNKAKGLENATKRLEALKQVKASAKGFANVTIANVRASNATKASVQGAIDGLNAYIKQVASVNGLDKKIVATLKGEAAQTLLQQVTNETLPLYIDNKGGYKVETLYRIVASKAKNADLRQILNNLKKQDN